MSTHSTEALERRLEDLRITADAPSMDPEGVQCVLNSASITYRPGLHGPPRLIALEFLTSEAHHRSVEAALAGAECIRKVLSGDAESCPVKAFPLGTGAAAYAPNLARCIEVYNVAAPRLARGESELVVAHVEAVVQALSELGHLTLEPEDEDG